MTRFRRLPRPWTARGSRALSWGLVDQTGSSATNLGLSVIAARILGPPGLGVIAIGFTAYLTLQAVFHAFVTDPMVVATAGADAGARRLGAQAAIAAVLGVAAATTALFLVLGLVAPAPVGRGLLLFAPWAGAAIVQDTWRAVLFRDERGAAAAANDGTWALGMLIMAPVAWLIHTDWVVVSTWGVGAMLSAIFGFAQTGVRPISPRPAVRWLRTHALSLGRWLAVATAVGTAGQQAVFVIVAALLGASSVGGLRAAQVIFAPMTLLAPALGLPALPALTRAAARSMRVATIQASRYSLIAVIVVAAYMGVAVLFRDQLLPLLFGPSFLRFRDLVFPNGVSQLLFAQALGFGLMLRVARRGRVLLSCQVAATMSMIGLVLVLSAADGVTGAAWAITAGMAVATLSQTLIACLQARTRPAAIQPAEI